MTRTLTTGALAGALMLSAAHAQAQAQDGDFAPDCVALFDFVEATPGLSLDDEPDLVRTIERNSGVLCRRELAALREETRETAQAEEETRTVRRTRPATERQTRQLQETETRTRQTGEREVATVASDTETVRQRVQLEEVVTVVGDVDVAVPAPTVEVRQRPAEVRVTPAAPEVTVRTGRPEIVVREQPATVTVGMPTITIEQPAPEITITLPPHDVDVATAQPRVEVAQADPVVRVELPDPRVDLDLRAVTGDSGDGVNTRVRRSGTPAVARQGLRVADSGTDALLYVADAEARVETVGEAGEARVRVEEAGEPRVRIERAEPRIEVQGEPEVRFERVGEPTVRVVQEGAEGAAPQRAVGGDEDRPRGERAERRRERAERAAQPQRAASAGGLTVGDLKGRTVVGRNGEDLGEVSRFVRSGGETYAVLSFGGFLGIGDREAPLALSDLRLRGEDLVAPSLTEARVDELRDRDISERLNLDDDEAVRIRAE